MENNNLRNPGVPYAASGVSTQPVPQASTPLFADVSPRPMSSQQITPSPSTAAPIAPPTAPLPAATPPTTHISMPPAPKKPHNWRRIILTASFTALFFLLLGAGWLIFESLRTGSNEPQANSEIENVSIPLSEFASSGSLNLLGTQSLVVNGQLRANESFVLAPQTQPSRSERGQLYFDANTNQLAYYNGSQFVQVPGEEASVLTLQGQSGNITLVGGAGLAVNGTTLTNTGVTSLGGNVGDITLGSGVSIVDGALTNTGVVGATGSSGISVVNDGNGNITISNTGAGTGTVTSPNGTPGRIAKFTGVQTIEDSLLSEAGSAVTVNGDLNVTGTTTLATALGVNSGGTGGSSFSAGGVIIGNGSGALTAVTAGGPGECLISTAGAPTFQACPGGGGGVTALNGLSGALTVANASAAGSTITINDASTSQKGIAQFNSTNFSVASGVVNTIQDINVAAAPTFGRLNLASSQATSPMLLVNNTNGSGTGNLIDLQTNGVTQMAVSPAGNMILTGTLNGQTISSAANFTGSLAVAGVANLNGGANVTGTLTANTITPNAAMTVGASGQSLTLQGNASTTLRSTSGANTTTVAFQSPTANVNYRLLTAAAGTYDICTTVGNCTGVGGGVTTPGGTINSIPKFTGTQTLGDSIISDNGSTVSIGGVLAVNTITPTGALTIGATSQALTLQGTTTSLSSTNGGFTNTLGFATPSGSNKTITVPNASGTLVVSASGPLAIDASGNITCATCAISGSGVTSLNGLTGGLSLAYATGSGSTVTIQDASTVQKGVAQFNSTNFSVASGVVNTIQDISVAATPTFGRLTVTSSQASNAMLLINNTNTGASGNLLDVQLNGASRLAVTPAGAMTVAGTINGQTISSSASFTGTLAVTGAANLNGGATVTGTLTANTITPTSALTVGATNQSFLVQGNASSTITATSGANTTTVAFQTPTANVTYRLLTAAAGTYDICTTVGNCAGVGGGVTTVGGTTDRLAKFTGSNSIADSIITDNGTTVTIGGTLAVNTITPSAAATIGATNQNLTLQGAVTSLTSTDGGITNSLTFATPSGSNKTITIPNATGTVAVSASGPLSVDANGNITCATCVTSGGGGGGVGAVDSLNGLTGALSIANASGSGTTITINDASTSQKGIAQFNSTNFSVASGVVNTIQDINVAAAPTFGRLTVTSSQASNGMFLINNTNASGSGNLLDVQLNGASRLAVTPAGNMTLTGTLNGQTISSAASFTGTLAVAGLASLNGGATVGGTLTANTLTPTSSLTVGATNQSFLVQGSATSTISATSGGSNTTTLAFQSPTASVTYRFLTAAAGTYDVCTTVGNCAGVGGGVTTAGGTTNQLAKFTGSNAIGDSIISDNGATVTIGGTLAVNTLTPTAALTVGATAQNLTMQGATVNLSSTAGSITNTLTFATPSGSNKTITVPNASGTLVVSASGPLAIDASGNITCATCAVSGSGVTSLNGLTGALTIANASTGGSTITINDASTAQKGIAQFNSTNFTASAGVINTIQNINTTAAPQFGQLTLTSSQASAAMLTVNNTNASATGNLIDLQLNGSSQMAVSPAGVMTLAGTLNGQTISSAANFTGSLAVGTSGTFGGDVGVNGGDITSTGALNITPGGALTAGVANQSFLLQGNAGSTITATDSGSTTSLAFQTPTANVTYRLLTAAAGTYDICTTVGNCAGVGGSVTTPGGTAGRIAKFTSAGAIADSIMVESGSTITVLGTLAANTSIQAPLVDTASAVALNIGTTNATAINLNQNTVVAAGKSLTITGGNTAGRPGSPTEGMVYYDTDTKALISYANGKWQADRSTSNKIVAMGSPSSCTGSTPVASANPDGADYIVNSCTSAQTVINSAITSLPASGGKVYLMEGTYILDGSISLPSNVTLAGAGAATTLKFKNSTATTTKMIVNSNTSGGNTAITVRDMKLDGNRANQSAGARYGVHFTKVGNTAADSGAKIKNIEGDSFDGSLNCTGGLITTVSSFHVQVEGVQAGTNFNNAHSVCLDNTTNSIITDSTLGNGDISIANTSSYNTISGNSTSNAGVVGGSSAALYLTITGNNFAKSSGIPFSFGGGSSSITGNTFVSNGGSAAVSMTGSNNTISGNTIINSGGTNGITLGTGTQNIVSNNQISATGASIVINNASHRNTISGNSFLVGSAVGISIAGAVQRTYLSNNSSTSTTEPITISDAGTDTIYANQLVNNTLAVTPSAGMSIGTTSTSATLTVQGGYASTQLPTPLTPTVLRVGSSGSATWGYRVSAVDGNGETLASNENLHSSGVTTLTGSNYYQITWNKVNGAVSYKVYRTTSGGTPSTTGLIGTVSANSALSFNDIGGTATGAIPAANTTGGMSLAGGLQGTNATFSSANSLTLGTSNSATGSINFKGASGTNSITLIGQANPTSNQTITLPDGSGTICLQNSASCGFATSTGASGYIQNGTTLQTNASMAIQSASDSAVTILARARATQGADIFRVEDSSANYQFAVDNFGNVSAAKKLTVEQQVGIGIAASSSEQLRIKTASNTTYGLTVTGSAAQTANLIDVASRNVATSVFTVGGTGAVSLQNTADSNAALTVNNAAGRNVVRIDTTSSALIVGNITSTSGAGVVGTIRFADGTNNNLAASLQLAGTLSGAVNFQLPNTLTGTQTICVSGNNCNYAPATGSTAYIQNGTTLQSANFYVQSATSGTIAAVVRGHASGSGGILSLKDSAGVDVMTVSSIGATLFQNSLDSVSALTVKDAAGTGTVFNVDTSNGRVGVGGISGFSKFEVQGGDAAIYNSGASPRLILGDSGTFGQNGYLQWDSASDYFRIETIGSNGLKIKDNNISIGNVFPGEILTVANGSTQLFQVQATGGVSVTNKLTTGSLDGAGLTDCDASNSKLLWDATTSTFSCGTDRASFTARKATNEVVNNSATLQDDDTYTFSIGANETWAFQIYTDISSTAAADFQAAISAPSGATCRADYNNLYDIQNHVTTTCGATTGTMIHSDNATHQYLIYGTVVNGATPGNVTLRWAQGTATAVDTTMYAGGHMVAYKLSGADLAEAYYTNDKTVGPGDVVQADGSLAAGVKKTTNPYSQGTLGVVSTNPGMILGDKAGVTSTGKSVLLALNGRVPVKVSTENGPIHAGDYLTASSKPGVAMKATRPGNMIGTALEDFNTTSPSGIGLTNVFINPSWATPDTSGLQVAAQDSDLQGQKAATFNQAVTMTDKLTVADTLSVDPANRRVTVGKTGGDAYGTLLVLGIKTTPDDPVGTNGAMYYNAASDKFRCFEGGTWKDCVSDAKPWSVALFSSDKGLADCTLSATARTLGDCITSGANSRFITKTDTTKATVARVVASGYDAMNGGAIKLQYSNDGRNWKYLDGSNGPSQSTEASPSTSDWTPLAPEAKGDVWIRAVVNGSGTLTSLTNVTAQFK